MAAWFVVLLAVAAGLAFLNLQQYAASHCQTTLVMPRVLHRPVAVAEDWEDLMCSSGPCSYLFLVHEPDDQIGGAPEPADDPVANPGDRPSPPNPIENTGKKPSDPFCS